MKIHAIKILFFLSLNFTSLLLLSQEHKYTHSDSLQGCITKERVWWDVTHYDLHVSFNYLDSSIYGYNTVSYNVRQTNSVMQIDLMSPMVLDSAMQKSKQCQWRKDGNAYFISLASEQLVNAQNQITLYFHGKPRVAELAPWDGGLIWAKDKKSNPWISIACQGMAASVWFPNKDQQYDEVDSASMHYTAAKELITVSNGKLRSKKINVDSTTTYNWVVKNPINNYNIIPYIGSYVNFKDTFNGQGGMLDLDFWVMENNLAKAKKQFAQVKTMLRCFENWFGKYPFYEDGYKLVEAPFLGMEHQSAIAYGNNYENGYKGRDLSLSGWGLKWDFIIIHESGHEWFGNNISAKDVADNWIHESFTSYAECLYTEYLFGKKAGADYVTGTRAEVLNDKPMIGDYNVNNNGSGDIYFKGANLLHTIRQLVNNDSAWKGLLRGINQTFWHQTVTTKQVEDYMSTYLKLDLQKVFDQYLRTAKIPVLEYEIKKSKLLYRWTNCVANFNMPLSIITAKGIIKLKPTENWQTVNYKFKSLIADSNFYVETKLLKQSN
jgi:aminopeptidase N